MSDHSEKKVEDAANTMEHKNVALRQRMEAQRAAEIRSQAVHQKDIAKNAGESKSDLEAHENRSPARNLNPNEVAELRKRSQPTGGLEQLARARNLSETQRQGLLDKLDAELDKTDPYWQEADRRTTEGEAKFAESGAARQEFCHVAGTMEHSRWEKEFIQAELNSRRTRGVDFEVEAVIHHPDGKTVRLDYVDYRKDIIIDRKPMALRETDEQLMARHEKQRKRQIEAYEHTTGRKVLEYRYSLYPSPCSADG